MKSSGKRQIERAFPGSVSAIRGSKRGNTRAPSAAFAT